MINKLLIISNSIITKSLALLTTQQFDYLSYISKSTYKVNNYMSVISKRKLLIIYELYSNLYERSLRYAIKL